MPTYEFRCQKCGTSFAMKEKISEFGSATAACPACKSADVERVISASTRARRASRERDAVARMFERVRQSLREALAGGSTPAAVAMMRDALVEAKLAVTQSREARDAAAVQLAREQAELDTVRRRGELAAQITDAETVAVAARFETEAR